MRTFLLGSALLFTSSVFAQQTVTEQFQKIQTVAQAQAWADANKNLKPAIFALNAQKDTSLINKRLLRQKKGDIFSVGYTTYKVLEATEKITYRANYIFLDGSTLTTPQVDSLKKIILDKYAKGTSWDKLSDEYTMDGNSTHGDTGWFFGEEMMPKEFQDAVANHKLGDVFNVDVSDKQWHYIVKKTFDDDDRKDITVLRATGR
jgi:parvulin-like peptidyl-prolyl isomerase